MKQLVKTLVYGTSARNTLMIVFAVIFTAAFACESGGDKVPPDA